MKNIKNVYVLIITLLFISYTGIAQEENEETSLEVQTIKGVFDGSEGGSYSFKYKNEEGDSDVIFFDNIKPEVLKAYNLNDKKLIGKTFEITFDTLEEEEIDDDGDSQYNRIRTITLLKEVK
ncbi:hypothetical protein [Aquimarina muelleri]|uniref:Uncharacterized protein n=1 Tax=Aquimarina muelleri TaxID=279356 RepID=A0A918N2S5_9FLAO|nr:hypothetical protein [Aquimarina muelleri]MCX2763004.1 hypothetical protein [Aquimarina muelleri]GGX15387.1 hypothetical protein GCM10007384_16330 [Aquimarina muelleri]